MCPPRKPSPAATRNLRIGVDKDRIVRHTYVSKQGNRPNQGQEDRFLPHSEEAYRVANEEGGENSSLRSTILKQDHCCRDMEHAQCDYALPLFPLNKPNHDHARIVDLRFEAKSKLSLQI